MKENEECEQDLTKEVDIGSAIKSIFNKLEGEASSEARSEPIFKFLMARSEWFKDPEETHLMVIHDFNKIIKEVVKVMVPGADYIIQDIYVNWDWFDNVVTRLCKDLYGAAFSADIGRFIVKAFIKYRLTGEIQEFNRENYWEPNTGEFSEWMDLVAGVASLRVGNVLTFAKAYAALTIKEG